MTQRDQEKDFNKTVSSKVTSSSSTTTMAHEARRSIDPQDLEAIRTGYVDVLGPLNIYKARDIETAFECGLQASAILDAIYQTALAARPTHAYLRAVLRRYASHGIYTEADAEADREEYRIKREAAYRDQRATWYRDPENDFPF